MKKRRMDELAAVVAAEDALISILLKDPKLLAQCELKASDWQCAEYEAIYGCMVALFNEGAAVDIATVGVALGERLGSVGGVAMFHAIAEDFYPGHTAGFSKHVEFISRVARNRRMEAVLEEQLQRVRLSPFSASFSHESTIAVSKASEGTGGSGGRQWAEIIDSASAGVQERHVSGGVSGVRTGIVALDSQIECLGNGELIVLAARPGMGKSALAAQIAKNVAGDGGHVAFFTMEMKGEELAYRFAARKAQVSLSLLRKGRIENGHVVARSIDALQSFRHLPVPVFERGKQSVEFIRREASALRAQKKLKLVVIDYLQLMDTSGSKGATRDQALGEITRALKQMAMDLDIPVVLLSQMNRGIEQSNRKPVLADLRESGNIEQDADIVVFIYQEDLDQKSFPIDRELIVRKARAGGAGDVPVTFDGEFA